MDCPPPWGADSRHAAASLMAPSWQSREAWMPGRLRSQACHLAQTACPGNGGVSTESRTAQARRQQGSAHSWCLEHPPSCLRRAALGCLHWVLPCSCVTALGCAFTSGGRSQTSSIQGGGTIEGGHWPMGTGDRPWPSCDTTFLSVPDKGYPMY